MNRVFGILNRCTGNKEADTPAPGVCRKIYINIDTVYIENKSFLQYFFHIFCPGIYCCVCSTLSVFMLFFLSVAKTSKIHNVAQQTMVI